MISAKNNLDNPLVRFETVLAWFVVFLGGCVAGPSAEISPDWPQGFEAIECEDTYGFEFRNADGDFCAVGSGFVSLDRATAAIFEHFGIESDEIVQGLRPCLAGGVPEQNKACFFSLEPDSEANEISKIDIQLTQDSLVALANGTIADGDLVDVEVRIVR